MENEKINSITHTTFKVQNMVCEGCAEKITIALRALPGVNSVKSKALSKQVQVSYTREQINQDELKRAFEKEGYPALEL